MDIARGAILFVAILLEAGGAEGLAPVCGMPLGMRAGKLGRLMGECVSKRTSRCAGAPCIQAGVVR
jgi:hypothetical protein